DLLTAQQNDQHSALLWAGIGALATFGHVPKAWRSFLQERFAGWDDIEKRVKDMLGGRQKGAEAALDPTKEVQAITDHINQKLGSVEAKPTATEAVHRSLQNLVEKMPGEPDLRDPAGPIKGLEGDVAKNAQSHLARLADVVDALHSGLHGVHENPTESIMRALAGHTRSMDADVNDYFESLKKLVGDVPRGRRVDMMKAAEGDMEVYKALEPQDKVAVDSWRVFAGALREASLGTKYPENFIQNSFPRLDDIL